MNKPKILLFDIETMANLIYAWGKYEQDAIAYKRHWYMLTFAYKWLDEKKTYCRSLPDYPLYKKEKENDRELVKELWNLFNEADIIVAHNGNSFDIKKANARFVKHGLTPPSASKYIDTKLEAKKYLKMDSNKLDDLGDYFGIGRKINTGGFELWLGCEANDPKAWKKMCEYNIQDVILLEKVFLKLRPWMKTYPIYEAPSDKPKECHACFGTHIQSRGTEIRVGGKVVGRFQCQSCGKWLYGKVKKHTTQKSMASVQ